MSSEKKLILRKICDGSMDDDQSTIRSQVGLDGGAKKCKIGPKSVPVGYELFIQSTSPNRKLSSGPLIVISPDLAAAAVAAVSHSIKEEDDIPIRSQSRKRGRSHESESKSEHNEAKPHGRNPALVGSFTLRSGWLIDSVMMNGSRYGGNGGSAYHYTVPSNEVITSIEVYHSGEWIGGLIMHSSTGARYGRQSDSGGVARRFDAPSGYGLVGVKATSGYPPDFARPALVLRTVEPIWGPIVLTGNNAEGDDNALAMDSGTTKRMKLIEDTMDNTILDGTWNMNTTHPNLRHLTINPRFESTTLDASLLGLLPQSLHVLKLHDVSLQGVVPSIASLYPNLIELFLTPFCLSVECLGTLPSTLRCINIHKATSETQQHILNNPTLLPHAQLSLSISSLPTSLLPSTITSLDVSGVSGHLLQPLLPPTLTHISNIDLSNCDPLLWPPSLTSFRGDITISKFPKLPRNLKVIDMPGVYNFFFDSIDEDEVYDDNDDLPGSKPRRMDGAELVGRDTLNTIDATRWSELKTKLLELTREDRLEAVERYISRVEQGMLYGLPLTLTHVKTLSLPDAEYSSWLMPPFVQSMHVGLHLSMIRSTTFWELLPASLTHLGIEWPSFGVDGEGGCKWKLQMIDDPSTTWLYNHPNLTSLDFPLRAYNFESEDSDIKPYSKYLPRGLTHLELTSLDCRPCQELEHLPPNLTSLEIHAERIYEDCPWVPYLPRNLKRLVVDLHMQIAPSEFSELPPSLEVLGCRLNSDDTSLNKFVGALKDLPTSIRSFLLLEDADDSFSFHALGPRSRFRTLSQDTIKRLLCTDWSTIRYTMR